METTDVVTIGIRALIQAVPYAGSPLDTLIFGSIDAIKDRKLRQTIQAINERIENLEKSKIDVKWFESEEALAAFRIMVEKISFEPSSQKINDTGRVFATLSHVDISNDPLKLSVFDHINSLSPVQTRLLRLMSKMQPSTKTLSGGAIEQTLVGLWFDEIVKNLQGVKPFWQGALQAKLELEILRSMGFLENLPIFVSNDCGYRISALGLASISYINLADLS